MLRVEIAETDALGLFSDAFAYSPAVFWRFEPQQERLLLSGNAHRVWSSGGVPKSGYALLRCLAFSDRKRLLRGLRSLVRGDAQEVSLILRLKGHGASQAHVFELRGRGIPSEPRVFAGTLTNTALVFAEDILNAIPTPVFVKDEERRRWVAMNTAFEDLVGMDRSSLLGLRDRDVFPLEQATHFERMDDEAFVLGGNEVEEPIDDASGEQHWLLTRKAVLTRKDGVRYIVGVISNITAQKRNEMELQLANQEALAAAKAKAEFLANMSHEIRTPMNGVVGLIEDLRETPGLDEHDETLRLIQSSARGLLTVINDILDLSKLEAGRVEIHPDVFDMRELCLDILRLQLASRKSAEVSGKAAIASDIRYVQGDPHRLRQILNNLLGNAFKFTEKGQVRLEAKRVDKAQVEFQVIDSGIGIPRDKIDRLFAPFEQADSSTTRRFGGTGLGLSISRHLIELMGGSVSVTSEVGKGSIFRVVLPLEAASLKPKTAINSVETSIQGLRVLVAEDNRVNRIVAERLLRRLGCEVVLVEDGKDAVDILASARDYFDLVLMDCQMPVLDGYEATRRIRALPGPVRNIPIVALTAHALNENREACLQAGMNEVLSKPIVREKFTSVVAGVIPRVQPDLPPG